MKLTSYILLNFFQTFSLSKLYFMKNSFDMSIILFSLPHPCTLNTY